MDWNDLRLFVLTARLGGLGAAARAAGVSAPTLGRRLAALEAGLGRPLFERRPTGYVLTAAGRELLEQAEPVEAAMLAVERWRDRGAAGRVVRISAGSWTSRFLAQRVDALVKPGEAISLQILVAEARLDIGRRAADIGLRAVRPDEAWLAGRRIGAVAYAIYGTAGRPSPERFVAATGTLTASSRWLRAEHGAAIGIEADSPRLLLDLALAGAGRVLLPCFVGDAEPGLARLGAPIAALDSEQWLVLHHDDRHDPAVRLVAGRLVALMRAHRAAFAGRSGPEQADAEA
jgi:DNA-binding transcriptional LysR family regulator